MYPIGKEIETKPRITGKTLELVEMFGVSLDSK